MQHDRLIKISTANSRRAKRWQEQSLLWSEMVDRIRVPNRGSETLAEYMSLPKGRQDELKDVGGYVAGTLVNGCRKAGSVTGRDVVTLDLDNIPAGQTDNVLRRLSGLGCGYAVYSTRKHCDAAPRLRVLLPLNRTVSADEYEPIARKTATYVGIDMCDPTTFQVIRLMYWPSCSNDSQYIFAAEDKPFLDPDGILNQYNNWHDVGQWPGVTAQPSNLRRQANKQGDPTAKRGVVGAFCRIYDIPAVMEKYIPGEYIQCDGLNDRYTYAAGSTTGGAIVYDDGKFLYSHHATDPAGGRLCNAFDLVRLHLYGDQDDETEPGTPVNRLPSYAAMQATAAADSAVTALINQERYEDAIKDFSAADCSEGGGWLAKLDTNSKGEPVKTIDNVIIVLENDPLLKGKLAYDEFSNKGLATGALPWDDRTERREWTDTDDAGLRHYIEKTQNITGKDRIADAAILVAHKVLINDVKDYIIGLRWDGVKRLDTLLIDYLGAEDTPYTRAVTRISLTAAVARVLSPGIKYDNMPIFTGPQGIGKSTFLRLLGRRWYSDSLTTFEGKEAAELIQGIWITEVGELSGLTRSETNAVKQFLSRTEDIYRAPYGRRTKTYPRRGVFFGTTNDDEFLKDKTGNRRFWPVKVGLHKPVKCVFTDLETEVDQIWAEALTVWQCGQKLYLPPGLENLARAAQDAHRESSAKEGLIREFLAREVPTNWQKRDVYNRLTYWAAPVKDVETEPRDRVCAAEIWVECLNGNIRQMSRADAMEINGILSILPGWEKAGPQRCGPYGHQKAFKKR